MIKEDNKINIVIRIQDKLDELEDCAWNREEFNVLRKRREITELLNDLLEVEE